jgi:hypothetical protein
LVPSRIEKPVVALPKKRVPYAQKKAVELAAKGQPPLVGAAPVEKEREMAVA